jgi:hypothetical protein
VAITRQSAAPGDLDFRGTPAVGKQAAVGFQQVRVCITVDTAVTETEEQLETPRRATERHCVICQTLTRRQRYRPGCGGKD